MAVFTGELVSPPVEVLLYLVLIKWIFLLGGYPSCHPAISVKALQGRQSTDPNQWFGLVLSSSTPDKSGDASLH